MILPTGERFVVEGKGDVTSKSGGAREEEEEDADADADADADDSCDSLFRDSLS